jgi:Transposase DDE domain
MSYGRMEDRAAELETEVADWLRTAEAADAEEDKLHGRDKSGDELPDWVVDKQRRAEKIRQAKAELEAEAKAAAEAELKEQAEAAAKREAEGRRKGGRSAAPPSTTPDAKAQKNFTDPESRIMKSKDGFVQAYNAQIAVCAEAQIIVAHDVTQSGSDCAHLLPMTDAVEVNLGRRPEQISADAGYSSQENLAGLEGRNIDAYVATGRARDAVAGTAKDIPASEKVGPPTRLEAMRAKIKAGGHTSPYRLRKQLPEPVFGQIKQARGFRQFLLRCLEKVRAEWALICTAHNFLRLAKRWSLSPALLRAAGAT